MDNLPTARTPERVPKRVLIASTVLALWFLNSFAFRYLTVDPDRFGIYWPRHQWLYAHVVAGMTALLLAPLQLWLGLSRREMLVHRIFGGVYVASVLVGGIAAIHLAWDTDFGWVFGLGLTEMGVAWIISTALATIAVLRHLTDQHHEWMLRSYTLTFGFVTFRMLTEILQVAGVGTTMEQMTAASWFSWSVPLFFTECLIQGRKILNSPPRQEKARRDGHERRGGADQQIELFDQPDPAEASLDASR